jgi:23S rRNA pseudouridine2605 synthase
MPAERLQKIIAAAGIASRRKSEELITAGRVVVNGQVVTELGTKADPQTDHIRVDGKLLQGPERFTYVVLNKPRGYVTTVSDEKKRPTVMDLVQKVKGRVYPVGRLDWASEGLILMTNDGELANALMKPASHVPKVYVVKVAGQPDEAKLDKLRHGVSIAEKGGRRVRTAPAKIRLIREGDNPWLEVTIIEGRNRQVRKMFEEVGHHVEKIRRVQYGPLALDVPPGDWRNLTLLEVSKLKAAASGVKVASPPSPQIALHPPKPAVKFSRTPGSRPDRSRPDGSRPVVTRTPKPASFSKPPRSTGPSKFGSKFGKTTFVPRAPRPAQSEKPSFTARPPVGAKRPFTGRPSTSRPATGAKPSFAARPSSARPSSARPTGARPARPAQSGKPSFVSRSAKPSRTGKPAFSPRSPRPFQSSKPRRPANRKRD